MNLTIGSHALDGRALLAPMAGVTDRPFRQLCRRLGAALAPAEMLTADARLWGSAKSRRRMDHAGEPSPRVVQLAGADPAQLAEAARRNVALGADIIDINMGCPARKVYNRACGAALLADEVLVGRILEAVVAAAGVPVTVKIRTGIDPGCRNAARVVAIAAQAGVCAVTVHGRTRADGFRGRAEHDTLAALRPAVAIPLVANGDIADAGEVARVLAYTQADAVMIGRAAQGSPWIFRDVNAQLRQDSFALPLLRGEKLEIILCHLESLYAFYGEYLGVRMARKHLGWYGRLLESAGIWRPRLMAAEDSASQFAVARAAFGAWAVQAAA
ncbi:MAG: tRNA dihydrouridine synthase DusB [Gammaproteobacteria bacterium]|nr:tRNA dihydrouridine synthase DusB [Gammaproteobacteria bacterium]